MSKKPNKNILAEDAADEQETAIPAETESAQPETVSEKPEKDNAAKEEQTGNVMYIGPTIAKVVKMGTVYKNGSLPEALEKVVEDTPMIRRLLIDIENVNGALKDIRDPKSVLGRIYTEIKEKFKEVK